MSFGGPSTSSTLRSLRGSVLHDTSPLLHTGNEHTEGGLEVGRSDREGKLL